MLGSALTTWFTERSWWQIALISLVMNTGIVANSAIIWRLAHRRLGLPTTRPVSRRDRALTASTVAVNAAALIPAWWLWTEGIIELASPQYWRVPFEALYLVLAVDVVMYWVHRIFHIDPLYRWFHRVHHTGDTPNNELTLFVMHPLEAAGFGMLTLTLLVLWPVSIVGISLFFTINLLTGTIAHLPVAGPPSRFDQWFGGPSLHQAHHAAPKTGYGFFTTASDRLFGSLPERF